MGFNTIHETVVNDVLDSIRYGVQWIDGKLKPKSPKIRTAGSLARATSGLTLTFPVICTDTLDVETAVMISKAIERKNIALLQMAFSAYNITNATDAISHLSKFHTNMDVDKITVDRFIDFMDSVEESASMTYPSEIRMINEDCKYNCNNVMEDSLNESSLMEFSQVKRFGQDMIIHEEVPPIPNHNMNDEYARTHGVDVYNGYNSKGAPARYYEPHRDLNGDYSNDYKDYLDTYQNQQFQKERDAKKAETDRDLENLKNTHQIERDNREYDYKSDRDRVKDQLDQDKLTQDRIRNNNDARKAMGSASNDKRQYLQSQLLPTDVKKANEMQPSLMIVNFYVNDADRDLNIAQQVVAGVKSKLYPVSSSDIMTKIITKVVDSDAMLKLVKVSTREISFVKDFLLGLDQAKLDALSKSRRGSGSVMFKALEKRALKGKIRRTLKLENAAKAISTLVITVEEAEELKKYNNIDVMTPRVIAKFMEKMNLLYFVVVDTTSEAVNIFTDGDSQYEQLSFSALERETGDGAYKKVVKLMTNMS